MREPKIPKGTGEWTSEKERLFYEFNMLGIPIERQSHGPGVYYLRSEKEYQFGHSFVLIRINAMKETPAHALCTRAIKTLGIGERYDAEKQDGGWKWDVEDKRWIMPAEQCAA